LPVRISESATSIPSMKPLQALVMSNTRARCAPSASATALHVAGSMKLRVMPQKRTTSTASGSRCAWASALRPAAAARSLGSTSGAA
jgi:hypothetical protein